jgi:hypothetical protein
MTVNGFPGGYECLNEVGENGVIGIALLCHSS